MKKIINYILRHDRLKHFFLGSLIFIFCTLFWSNLISLGIVTIVATLKEVYDEFIKGTGFDPIDLFYTILTGILITIIW